MNKRFVSLILVLLTILVIPFQTADAKSYSADRFDVVIDVQPDGSFIVTEAVTFRFVGGPYTYAFREIELNEVDRIEFLEAAIDGQVLPRGTEAGQVEVNSDNDPVEITWHFAPLSDEVHTYTLRYRVIGNVRAAAGQDVLSWQAIPEEHEYTIDASTITVNYPKGVEPVRDPQLQGSKSSYEFLPGQAKFATGKIDDNEALILTVQFPGGQLISEPPAWQLVNLRRGEQVRSALPVALVIGLIIPLGWLAWLLPTRKRAKIEPMTAFPTGPVTQLPDDLHPAAAGQLVHGNTTVMFQVFAVVLDLARRGLLRLEELPAQGWFNSKDYVTVALKSPSDLQAHEQRVWDFIFENTQEGGHGRKVSELGTRFSNQLEKFRQEAKEELLAKGLLDAQRDSQRIKINFLALGLFLVSVLMIPGGLVMIGVVGDTLAKIGTVLLGTGIGLTIAGSIGLGVAAGWPVWTAKGQVVRGRWQSFDKYLRELLRRDSQMQGDWFEPYLPYAVAFGLGDRWVKAFQEHGLNAVLPWLLSSAGTPGDLSALSAVIIINTSTSSAGGSAGGGGGGSSGAG